MKILDNYLLKSIIKSSLATLFSLVFLFSFFQFIEEMNEIGVKEYTLGEAIKYVLFLSPSYFNSLIVLSLMIGTIFSVGQLNSNRELQIYQTASISEISLIGKTIKYPLFISIILITFFESITPQSLIFADHFKSQALGKFTFQKNDNAWFKEENDIYFLSKDELDNYSLKVFNVEDNTLLSYRDAKQVFFSEDILSSDKSRRVEFKKNKRLVMPEEFLSEEKVYFNFGPDVIESLSKNVKSMSVFELIRIIFGSYQNQNKSEIITETISRIIKPITLVGMILLAIPYILNFQRNISIGKRIFLSIIIGTITHLFTKILSIVSLKFDSMSVIGPILPTIIIILAGILLINVKTKVSN